MADENTDYLIYEPAPPKPENFDAEILKIVGTCPNGVDPYVRFVWGMDRTEVYGDKVLPRYPDSDDKYVGLPFWIIEGWQSPDVYDPLDWEAHKDILGEFPRNGVYDFIEVYRTPDYRMMPLGRSAYKKAREWRFWKSKPKKRAVADLLADRAKIAEFKEKRWEAKKAAIYTEFIEAHDRLERLGALEPVFSFPTTGNGGAFKQRESGIYVPNN